MTATATGLVKNLRATIKERVAMTAIRLSAVEVKENRGAICKIAPRNVPEAINKTTNIITEGRVYGAISEIAPEETTKQTAKGAMRGAIFKIAP